MDIDSFEFLTEEQLSERLAANHIHEKNPQIQAVKKSRNVVSKFVGGWMGWLGAGSRSIPTDFSGKEESLDTIAGEIFRYLDDGTLASAEFVYEKWHKFIDQAVLWKTLIERKVTNDSLWRKLAERKGWIQYLFEQRPCKNDSFYGKLFSEAIRDIKNLENNWRNGNFKLRRIDCGSEGKKGVYCIQYDDEKIVTALRDGTIKVWDSKTLECKKVMWGHTSSVLCMQYDDKIIVSGSSDTSVRIWNIISGGQVCKPLMHHDDAVLYLKFKNCFLVTCSKDCSIAILSIQNLPNVQLIHVLPSHRAAVNVLDFDEKYIVSASADRTIKVWNVSTFELVRTLEGHKGGIASLQYRDGIVISGCSNNSIRIWDIETGECLRSVRDNSMELVRCLRFDSKDVIVWDLAQTLNSKNSPIIPRLQTLKGHTAKVLDLQFDEFQIISCSHDDTVVIWDFLNYEHDSSASNNNVNQSNTRSPTSPSDEEDESFIVI